uniref:hypothetical protein n=1 Tax=Eubacterium sp. TaxID=142586 RepID=UPI0040297F59
MEQKIEVDKLIFDFVYELALRDAVMRTAYLGDKSELRKNEYAKNIVRDYADDIINKKSFDYYDIAKKLCDEFNSEKNSDHQFTFGNAQKLLNMTMKYLYIMCYKNNELRDKFQNCHCPMDGIMIDKVINELKKLKSEGDSSVQQYTQRGYIGKLKGKPWSRLVSDDKAVYEQFQKSVKFLAKKQDLYPLEYDYFLWNS